MLSHVTLSLASSNGLMAGINFMGALVKLGKAEVVWQTDEMAKTHKTGVKLNLNLQCACLYVSSSAYV